MSQLDDCKPNNEENIHFMYVRLPDFIPEDPEFWLAQVESQFSTMSIRSEERKLRHLVAAIPRSLAPDVRDIVLHPPAVEPYSTLRDALLRRTAMSEEKRIRNLLDGVQMDDRSPSQLLRHMQQLAGDTVIPETVLRQLWLKRLPEKVRHVISIFSSKSSLEELAEGATAPSKRQAQLRPLHQRAHPQSRLSWQRLRIFAQKLVNCEISVTAHEATAVGLPPVPAPKPARAAYAGITSDLVQRPENVPPHVHGMNKKTRKPPGFGGNRCGRF